MNKVNLNMTLDHDPEEKEIKLIRKLMDFADVNGVLLNRIVVTKSGNE